MSPGLFIFSMILESTQRAPEPQKPHFSGPNNPCIWAKRVLIGTFSCFPENMSAQDFQKLPTLYYFHSERMSENWGFIVIWGAKRGFWPSGQFAEIWAVPWPGPRMATFSNEFAKKRTLPEPKVGFWDFASLGFRDVWVKRWIFFCRIPRKRPAFRCRKIMVLWKFGLKRLDKGLQSHHLFAPKWSKTLKNGRHIFRCVGTDTMRVIKRKATQIILPSNFCVCFCSERPKELNWAKKTDKALVLFCHTWNWQIQIRINYKNIKCGHLELAIF